jgi:hypothetical protein
VRTRREKVWRPRSIRDLVENEDYEGKNGYPVILDADLAQRARDARTRLDPSAVQRRKGGRPPKDPAYILRGLAFCACGAPMYTSQKGQPRAYVCRDVVQCTGVCTRPRIRAPVIEGHVLRHLDAFVGQDVEGWIAERLAARGGHHDVLAGTLQSHRQEWLPSTQSVRSG